MVDFYKITATLSADVEQNDTITLAYPTGTNASTFRGGYGHKLWASGLQRVLEAPGDFSITFGSSNITVTYLGATTIPAGSYVSLQADVIGLEAPSYYLGNVKGTTFGSVVRIDLGAPIAADADGFCKSQSVNANVAAVFDGDAVNSDGEAILDVPRNIVAGWTTTAVITVVGEDEYGNPMTEQSSSGTSFTGKKAFKKVTSVKFSANVTAATVGFGDVLGLPVFLPEKGFVLAELEDGAKPTAGTILAGVTAKATATTGDVRGTYDPNSAADGSKAFSLIAFVPDPSFKGVAQF